MKITVRLTNKEEKYIDKKEQEIEDLDGIRKSQVDPFFSKKIRYLGSDLKTINGSYKSIKKSFNFPDLPF